MQEDLADGLDRSYFYHMMESVSLKESFPDLLAIDVVRTKDEIVVARHVKKDIEEGHVSSIPLSKQ